MSKDIKWRVKELLIRKKFYHASTPLNNEKILFLSITDGCLQKHPGFVDRMKAIVGLYYIAEKNQRIFKMKYTSPLLLEDYLQPNEIDWQVHDEISYSTKDTKLISYQPQRIIPQLNQDVFQYHCYLYEGLNVLKYCDIQEWQPIWNQLFHKLFKPTEKLCQLCDRVCPREPFVAVHIRFINLLDDFEDGYLQKTSDSEKEKVVSDCIKALYRIKDREKRDIYVFSDSKRFLGMLNDKDFYHLDTEGIGHVSFCSEREVFEKTITDFFIISFAKKVYSVRGGKLYNSAFPEYAAIVGEKLLQIEYIEGER